MRTKSDDSAVKKAILEAAENEFISVGYAGAKTTSIARKACVTHTMLHYYFQTKENLFNVVLQGKFALIEQILGAFVAHPELPILERVAAIVRRQFDLLAMNPALPRFLVNEMSTNEQMKKALQQNAPALLSGAYVSLQADLDRAAASGEIRPIKGTELVFTILSLNAMSLMLMPFLEVAMNGGKKMRKADLEARREANVETILKIIQI